MSLNSEQRWAATLLKAERPEVIPGTNVIVDNVQRLSWYTKVTEEMRELKVVKPKDVKEFCDLAGVPD